MKDLRQLEKETKGESEEEIITTIKLERKNYIEIKKKLLEENKSFKDWVNTKMEEYVKNGNKRTGRNRE